MPCMSTVDLSQPAGALPVMQCLAFGVMESNVAVKAQNKAEADERADAKAREFGSLKFLRQNLIPSERYCVTFLIFR